MFEEAANNMLAVLQNSLDSKEAKVAELKKVINSLNSELNGIYKAIELANADAEAQIDKHKTTIDELQVEIVKLEDRRTLLNKQADDIEKYVADQRQAIKDERRTLVAEQNKLDKSTGAFLDLS